MFNKKYSRQVSLLVLCGLFSSLTACSDRKNLSPFPSISKEADQELKQPVNCNTAKADIAVLEEEHASVAKRIFSGVRSVFPIAAAAGILLGDYKDRVEVATGKYNDDLEDKINQIKTACGIQLDTPSNYSSGYKPAHFIGGRLSPPLLFSVFALDFLLKPPEGSK